MKARDRWIPSCAADQRRSALLALTFVLVAAQAGPAAAQGASQTVHVATVAELYAAVDAANARGNTEIVLAPGAYRLARALRIRGDHVTLRSRSLDRSDTVLRGNGMRRGKGVDNLVAVQGRHVSLIGLTLREAGNHLVQVHGEKDADHFRLIGCALIDGYEQLLKVSAGSNEISADSGLVRDTLFAYSREHGPNYYIGGIDIHRGRGWVIEDNTFRNIASPSGSVAEFAIHLWSRSADGLVRRNLILDCDRGIGFGLSKDWARRNEGGEILDNVIIHRRRGDPFADVGIALENSPGTRVVGNFIHFEHAYPNAIEYRFDGTRAVVISGNTVNRAIRSRDGGQALVEGNHGLSALSTGVDYLQYALSRLRERLFE